MTASQEPSTTNWTAYGIDEIWEMVRHETGDRNHDQIRAWHVMAVACEHYADRLNKAAEHLAERWPPQRNEAAAAFIRHLASFAANIETAAQKARSNAAAMGVLTGGLAEARIRVASLLEQRATCAVIEAERVRAARHFFPEVFGEVEDRSVLQVVQGSKFGRTLDEMGVPTVSATWREEYDAAARQVMVETDQIVADARTYFRVHDPFQYSATWPEARPVPGATAGPSAGGGTAGSLSSDPPPTPRFDPPPSRPVDNTSWSSDGPSLSGNPAPPPGTHGPSLPNDQRAESVHVHLPDRRFGDSSPIQDHHVVAGAPARTGAPPPVISPPGAVIGQRSVGPPPIAQTRGTSSAATPMNNYLETQNPNSRGTGPSIAAGGVLGAPHPQGGGRAPDRSRRSGWSRGSDSDDLWGIRRGVPPVIKPAPEPPRHDPGPNVIGIDR